MSVANGEKANQTVFNSSFMSKEDDSDTTGQIGLVNTDTASGASVTNTQRELNSGASFTGKALNAAKDVLPSWGDTSVGTGTDSLFARAEALTAAVGLRLVGPGVSTDNTLVRFDGTAGDTIQGSGISVDDSDNVTGVNDLTVDGDLVVNGTTTTVNTDTLDVEDANITVNKNGNQATANSEVAGITVEMSDSTDSRIGYDSMSASFFKAGQVGSESPIVTESATQAMANKTLNSPTINTPTVNTDMIVADEGTISFREDSGSGTDAVKLKAPTTLAGDVDFVLPPDEGTADYVLKTNGSGVTSWVPQTGGSNPAYQGKTANYTIAVGDGPVGGDASSGGFTFTFPDASGNDNEVIEVFRIDDVWNNVITLSGPGLTSTTLNSTGERVEYVSDGTTWILRNRSIPSIWKSFTAAISWSTNVTRTARQRRVGDSMEIGIHVLCSGAPTAATLTHTISDSLTIDTAKLPTTASTGGNMRYTYAHDASASANRTGGPAIYNSASQIRFLMEGSSFISNTVPFSFANNDSVNINALVPITGWNG